MTYELIVTTETAEGRTVELHTAPEAEVIDKRNELRQGAPLGATRTVVANPTK